MVDVRLNGLRAARHLEGGIYEVRADCPSSSLLSGKNKQVLLSLEGFRKKTQKTPAATIRLAKRRLKDWERRGGQRAWGRWYLF
jgi:phage-related protein